MQSLKKLVDARDVEGIKAFMAEHNMVVRGNAIVPVDDETKKKFKALEEFWNQRQQARKILLNSLYGALLNEGLRFYDERLGQSVTLTGRSIVRHMNGKSNEVITGAYDYTGDAIVYADTDSCYFTPLPLKDNPDWRKGLFEAFSAMEQDRPPEERIYDRFDFTNRDHIIRVCDDIADVVNDSFPEFMNQTFNTTIERGGIIKAGRELVASSGLFIKKKKYAVLMYDKEGDRYDSVDEKTNERKPGKLKAMGLDLKRADTPKFMQKFLEKCLMNLLTGVSKKEIISDIKEFRTEFKARPAAEKGSPKKVSGLTAYADKLDKTTMRTLFDQIEKKVNLPGHVKASMNWNLMCDLQDDKHAMRITDGSRIVVCKLKPNPLRIDSIAYPIDEPHLPAWFNQLPFDHGAMETTIIDNKLENLVGVLDWDLDETKTRPGDEFFKW
jgi:DNA polymerase elongation subunit (family B)